MKSQVGNPGTRTRTRASGTLASRANIQIQPPVETDAFAAPWSVTTTEPFVSVAVDELSGHLLVDLRSVDGCLRMQLTRRDLPVVLKTLIDAVGQLAAHAE